MIPRASVPHLTGQRLPAFALMQDSLRGGTFHLNAGISPDAGSPYILLLPKEAFGPPKSPSYPMDACPGLRPRWCPRHIAIARPGLLPSSRYKLSAFSRTQQDYPHDHHYTDFGAQYRACTLDPSSFVLPLLGLQVDFTTDLSAALWSGGI